MNRPTQDSGNDRRRNPCLFAVGCLRSGTTMFQRMLDSHPQLACAYDTLFIPSIIKDLDIGFDPPLTDEIVQRVTAHRRFDRLELSEHAIRQAVKQADTFSDFVSNLYDQYGRARGKPLAGEKSPGYCRHLPHLQALFPAARFIHLIRDGRDVALSVLNWQKGPAKLALFDEYPVGASALWWRWDVSVGRRDGMALGASRYLEVRYEDIVDAPALAMRRVADFIDLDYSDEMVAYHEGRQRSDPGLSAKAAWLPPTKGLRDWRTQMSPEDIELFEALAGNELAGAGYERAFNTISPGIRAQADHCRSWWHKNMTKRSSRLGTAVAARV